MKYFSTNDLPLNDEMIKFWNDNGYLVIENFNTNKECCLLYTSDAADE